VLSETLGLSNIVELKTKNEEGWQWQQQWWAGPSYFGIHSPKSLTHSLSPKYPSDCVLQLCLKEVFLHFLLHFETDLVCLCNINNGILCFFLLENPPV